MRVSLEPQSSDLTPGCRGTYDRSSAWLKTHAVIVSLLVFFCSVSLRLVMVMRADPNELVASYSDAGTYFDPAQNLIDRGAFLNKRGNPMIDRTPGYPTFLAGIMLLVGRDLRSVLIVQSTILALGPLFLYLLGRWLLPPAIALTAALIAAASPWGAVLAGAPMSDGLFLVLLTIIFLLMKVVEDWRFRNGLLGAACIGLLTGVTVLVRPIWPLALLVPGAMLLCYGPRRKEVWLLSLITVVFAVTPVALWKERNQREASFNAISDIAGQTVWRYLAARVRAEVTGQDRHAVSTLAYNEEHSWGLSISSPEADDERWKRAKGVFRNHPFVTIYSFGRSVFEHVIHPSADVLQPAKLNFHGDVLILAVMWGGLLLASSYTLLRPITDAPLHDSGIDRGWLLAILLICTALTLSSGISFAGGSRLRAPLEVIVPLLAAVSLVRAVRAHSPRLVRLFSGRTK